MEESKLVEATKKTHVALAHAQAALIRGRAVEHWAWPEAKIVNSLRREPGLAVDMLGTMWDDPVKAVRVGRAVLYRVLSPVSSESEHATAEVLREAFFDEAGLGVELTRLYGRRSDVAAYFHRVWPTSLVQSLIAAPGPQGTPTLSQSDARYFELATQLIAALRLEESLARCPLPFSEVAKADFRTFCDELILPAMRRALRLSSTTQELRARDELGAEYDTDDEEEEAECSVDVVARAWRSRHQPREKAVRVFNDALRSLTGLVAVLPSTVSDDRKFLSRNAMLLRVDEVLRPPLKALCCCASLSQAEARCLMQHGQAEERPTSRLQVVVVARSSSPFKATSHERVFAFIVDDDVREDDYLSAEDLARAWRRARATRSLVRRFAQRVERKQLPSPTKRLHHHKRYMEQTSSSSRSTNKSDEHWTPHEQDINFKIGLRSDVKARDRTLTYVSPDTVTILDPSKKKKKKKKSIKRVYGGSHEMLKPTADDNDIEERGQIFHRRVPEEATVRTFFGSVVRTSIGSATVLSERYSSEEEQEVVPAPLTDDEDEEVVAAPGPLTDDEEQEEEVILPALTDSDEEEEEQEVPPAPLTEDEPSSSDDESEREPWPDEVKHERQPLPDDEDEQSLLPDDEEAVVLEVQLPRAVVETTTTPEPPRTVAEVPETPPPPPGHVAETRPPPACSLPETPSQRSVAFSAGTAPPSTAATTPAATTPAAVAFSSSSTTPAVRPPVFSPTPEGKQKVAEDAPRRASTFLSPFASAKAAMRPSPAPARGGTVAERTLRLLSPPGVFLTKHCRYTRPHPCYIFMDDAGSRLFWTRRGRGTAKPSSVAIDEIKEIRTDALCEPGDGPLTTVLARHGKAYKLPMYLSLVTKKRTLDFECTSIQLREDLVASLNFLRDRTNLIDDEKPLERGLSLKAVQKEAPAIRALAPPPPPKNAHSLPTTANDNVGRRFSA